MTLSDYLLLFRRGWFVVLLFAVLGGVAAAALDSLSTPTYASRASVVVTVATDGSTGSLVSAGAFAVSRANTYAALATTDGVLDRAALVTGDDPRVLAGSVAAAAQEQTALIDITAYGSSAASAAARAEAVAEELTVQAQQLDTQYPGGPVTLSVVSRAQEPGAPTSPGAANNAVIGVVVGLALGVAAVVVGHSLDDRIRSAADVPRQARFASVTSLPVARRGEPSDGASDDRVEAVRRLRSTVDVVTSGGAVLAVAGASSSSGAAAVVRQLAQAIAEVGYRVVVVDVDLRSPASTAGPGLGEVLTARLPVSQVLTSGTDPGVYEVPRGGADASAAQLLGTPAMHGALDELTREHSFVILSCPPVRERAETAVLAAQSTAVLLVADAGSTRRRELLHAVELLSGLGVKNINLVLDRVRRSDLGRVADVSSDAAGQRGGMVP